MVARIWHGWTTHANAGPYERLLRQEVFPWIRGKEIPGFRGIHLLRREGEDEVEFVTLMWFGSLEDVRAFAGPEHAKAVVPDAARALLARFDADSAHYTVVEGAGDDG